MIPQMSFTVFLLLCVMISYYIENYAMKHIKYKLTHDDIAT